MQIHIEKGLKSKFKDNLNAADMMFNAGMDGCINISLAIMVANSPHLWQHIKFFKIRNKIMRTEMKFAFMKNLYIDK